MKIYKSVYVSLSVVSLIISITLGVAFITANKKAKLWERRSEELSLVLIDTGKGIDEQLGKSDDFWNENKRRAQEESTMWEEAIKRQYEENARQDEAIKKWNEETALWKEKFKVEKGGFDLWDGRWKVETSLWKHRRKEETSPVG